MPGATMRALQMTGYRVPHRLLLLSFATALSTAGAANPGAEAIDYCRSQALANLKYAQTVKWFDAAREEKPEVWLVNSVRTAKAPSGNVEQSITCRADVSAKTPRLLMLLLLKDVTKSGKDVFIIGW